MSNVTTVGIDLAKNVFSLHAVDGRGVVVLRKTVNRARLAAVVAQLPACLIGLEACSGAHERARRFARHGHTVRPTLPTRQRSTAAARRAACVAGGSRRAEANLRRAQATRG